MLQELNIRICAARNDSCRRNCDIVTTEGAILPFARSEHLRSDGTKLFACDSGFFEGCDNISVYDLLNAEKLVLAKAELKALEEEIERRLD